MNGIQYVTDEKGRPVAVQIDLKKHADLWEDFQDVLTCAKRDKEKTTPWKDTKAGLQKQGKI